MFRPAHLDSGAETQAEGIDCFQDVSEWPHVKEGLLNQRGQERLMRGLRILEVARVCNLLGQFCALRLYHIHLEFNNDA